MQTTAHIKEVSWQTHKDQLLRIRCKVFVEEQGVPAEIEVDEWDERSSHVIAQLKNKDIGTGRLLPDGHIGRIAVLAEYRKSGIGKAITQQLIAMARAAGHQQVSLSAQIDAKAFYANVGFISQGEPYEEAGITHIAMTMSL